MSHFCVSTKHLLSVPRIALGTCTFFLYNVLTQQTYWVYQPSSCAMQLVCDTCSFILMLLGCCYNRLLVLVDSLCISNGDGLVVVLSIWHRDSIALLLGRKLSQQRAGSDHVLNHQYEPLSLFLLISSFSLIESRVCKLKEKPFN